MSRFARFFTAPLFIALWLAPAARADAEVTTFTLENGMDVVVIEDNRAPIVTHMVWYRVGAADEPPGKSGIAHYLEHLMFKGTDEIPEGAFSKIVAENGGTDNAFTSWDYTGYFQRIAADRLDIVMRMEADRMRDLVISEAVWQPERDVILEERNTRVENDPSAIFSEQQNAALFLNHPYSVPIIGWRHEIEELTREDALDFYARYYAPNNAILIVAGDVTPDGVRELAEIHYGVISPNPDLPPRVRPQEPPQLSPRRITYSDPRVRQPYVIRTYLAPERDSGAQEEAAALTILARLLGASGITSVFGQRLQVEEGIALSTGAYYRGLGLDDQSFGIYAVPVPGTSLEEAEARLDAAIAAFLEEGPDPEHLERIKTQLRAGEIFARDDQGRLARRYGVALTAGLTVEDVEAWPDILDAVTAEDVMKAAENVFDIRRSVTGWLLTEDAVDGATGEVTQ